jgi:hypothetical protein
MVFGSRCHICGEAVGCDRSEHQCYSSHSISAMMLRLQMEARKQQAEEDKKKIPPHVENILEDI